MEVTRLQSHGQESHSERTSGSPNHRFGVKSPGPFLVGNCAEKARVVGASLKGGSEDFHRKRRGNRRK